MDVKEKANDKDQAYRQSSNHPGGNRHGYSDHPAAVAAVRTIGTGLVPGVLDDGGLLMETIDTPTFDAMLEEAKWGLMKS